jgi:hypothetical protein
MLPSYVALTTLTDRIRMDELARVAAALQTQVLRDFAPHWEACAVIAAAVFDAIPARYCPMIVQDTMETEDACGYHRTEADKSPYIVLPYGPSWSMAASHAVLTLLANPTGSGRRPGPSRVAGQGTVEYLLDMCAPCQAIASAYAIDGVVVSDFCTPEFFAASPGRSGPYSHTGAVRHGLMPAANGLLTWLADDGLLYQTRCDDTGRMTVRSGFSVAQRGRISLRELVDLITPDRLERLSNAQPTPALLAALQNARRVRVANMNRYREGLSWRFGQAVRPQPGPGLCARAQRQPDPDAPGQRLTAERVQAAARSD